MRRIAPFEEKPISPSTEVTAECETGTVLRDLQVKFGGVYNATGGTAAMDGPGLFLGRTNVKCGARNIVDMSSNDLRHLTALLAGCYGEISPGALAAAPTGITGKILYNTMLPFTRITPLARIDGRGEKITLKQRFGSLTELGATATNAYGTMRAIGTADDEFDDGDLFLEPDFRTVEIPLFPTKRNPHTVKFADDELIAGFMFRSQDQTQVLTDPNLAKVDWLIRRVSVERQKQGFGRQSVVPEVPWSLVRNAQTYHFGISAATGQIHNGIGAFMFDDPTTPKQEIAFFGAGDVMSIVVDCASPIEEEFEVTGQPTIEAGVDKAFVTILGFRPRGRAYFQDRRGTLARNGFAVS